MSNAAIQVIIADDHPILLKGLADFLSDLGLQVIGAYANGKETLEQIKAQSPQLAVLDLEMPGLTGLEVAEACQEENISTKFILLTLHNELFLLNQAKDLNLAGYILKDFALNDLSQAIETILAGGTFYSEKILQGKHAPLKGEQKSQLTPSEKKILRLISTGFSSKEIAEKLFISERTVEKHRSNMVSKLDLEKKSNSLLIWAQKNKDLIG
ncbi:response regulator [Algoriphagus vanfongensis]|uniref:response regulator n=1 Tax=Algoriphagus vanfongensis TaxID=426371 RepID=UPI0003FDED5C|nr:response regulator transcription factor [Algoriphagus vanfongensis]